MANVIPNKKCSTKICLPNLADSVMDRVKNTPNVLKKHLKKHGLILHHVMTFRIRQTEQWSPSFVSLLYVFGI